MNELADRLAGPLVSQETELTREFEARLADSSTLAVRVAYSVLRQRQDAEDVAQDAFVRAHRHFRDLRDREKFRAWLVRMTWRLALDWKRGHRRRVAREDAVAMMAPRMRDGEAEAIESDRSMRLWKAIDELPERLRVVIVLAAIEGHGLKDVSELLGVPEGTVKSRLFGARKQLQERLR
jgi:RNA polymerase sigma-70 factor (ECF subfamily)